MGGLGGGARRRAATWIGVAAAFLLSSTACTERTLDESVRDVTPSTTAPGAQPTVATSSTVAGSAFVERVAGVDTSDLVLGGEFNRQFLTLQFLAVGLDETESRCAADRVATAAGSEFTSRPVSQVMSGAGITPDVLMPCVPTERMMSLAASGGGADLGRVPGDVLRSTLTELASAGYESVGMTAVEATCLADAVVGPYTDADLLGVMTDLDLPADRAVAALPSCVTPARAAELGA